MCTHGRVPVNYNVPDSIPPSAPQDIVRVVAAEEEYNCWMCGKGPYKNTRGLHIHIGKMHKDPPASLAETLDDFVEMEEAAKKLAELEF